MNTEFVPDPRGPARYGLIRMAHNEFYIADRSRPPFRGTRGPYYSREEALTERNRLQARENRRPVHWTERSGRR
jgi:hypothetical protein